MINRSGSRRSARFYAGSAGAMLLALLMVWSAAPASAAPEAGATYRVQPGDTLSAISVRYGVSVADLIAFNGLADPDWLQVGQILIVDRAGAELVSADPPALISAPYIRQFDGSIYEESNCGPAALAMALGALDLPADPLGLRRLTSRQMGFDDPAAGTTWEAMAYAARMKGASIEGLYQGSRYRIWSTDDLAREFAQGHPVILLVRYGALPDHQASGYAGDHYIVGLGFEPDGSLNYHDPAFRPEAGSGANRTIPRDVLQSVWSNTAIGYIRTAMAVRR